MSLLAISSASFVIFAAAASHSFLFYPLSLRLLAPRAAARRMRASGEARPSIAVCLSIYNEAAVIVGKVESMLAQVAAYGPATIHVYADGCSDDSVTLLDRFRDRIDLVVSDERLGKTHGMKVLIGRSASDLLMFTDANVESRDDALIRLSRPFADPGVGCSTARLTYSNTSESATSFMGALYWSIEESVKRLESQTISVIGVDGATFLVRRDLYVPAPDSLIDDLYISLSVLAGGAAVVRMDDVVVTERSAVAPREEYRRKVRIACQAMNVHLALRRQLRRLPPWVRYGYVSHRLMKWMSPFFVAGAALSALAFLIALIGIAPVLGLLALGGLMVGVGAKLDLPPFSIVWTICLSLIGVGQGVLQSLLQRKTYNVWDPAASVRGSTTEQA